MFRQLHRAVVLGGGYAGIMAAQRLTAAGAQVTLINNRNVFVERIRLHQQAVGQHIHQHRIANLLPRAHTRFIRGHVQSVDTEKRRVIYSVDDRSEYVEYDTLVYTLGSTIQRSEMIAGQPFVYTLGAADVAAFRQRLGELEAGAQVVVCGGGLTGIEGATELAEAYPHLRVTLLTRNTVGEGLSAKGRAYLQKTFARLGIAVREHTNVLAVNEGSLMTSRSPLSFDACLWTGGFSVPTLGRDAGIAVNERNQIIVDSYLRSVSHPDIYAAGDAAFISEHPISIRMACATAVPMGGHAANNIAAKMAGAAQKPFSFRYFFQCISLGRRDALIQWVNPDDTPREQVITGRAGAVFKEMICSVAFNTLRLERYFPGMYRIPPLKVDSRRTSISYERL